MFKNVSKALKKVTLKMWFYDESGLFNAEFMWPKDLVE
jgi:hypothetical protein